MKNELIDLHTHILPGLDDGIGKIDESVKVLKEMKTKGVAIACLTPHVIAGVYNPSPADIVEGAEKLKALLLSEGVNISIILGSEVNIEPQLPKRVEEKQVLTINNKNKYLLVELPSQEIPLYTEETLFRLLVLGVIPVLAHPERNMAIIKNPKILAEFVKKGSLVQLNAGSILGLYSGRVKRCAKLMLTHNLVHVIASNIHSVNQSYTLIEAYRYTSKLIGEKKAYKMVSIIPKRIIDGEDFDLRED